MPEETLLPFLGVFIAVGLLFVVGWFIVARALERRRKYQEQRVNPMSDSDVSITLQDRPSAAQAAGPVGRFDRWFDDLISRTGLNIDTNLALALIVFCGVLPAAIIFVWQFEDSPWLALPILFLGMLAPFLYFIYRQGVWRRSLQQQLPDVFFLMARTLRAGRSIDQAVHLVGQHGVPPLSREFARMHRQMDLGLPLHQVLQLSSKRLRLVDFNVFASMLSLHRTTGGNLSVILDRLASATRDHNQFEGQMRASTVLGRYSAAFISLMIFVILFFLVFFEREWAARFFASSVGIFLFCAALGLMALGMMLLFWFLRTDY